MVEKCGLKINCMVRGVVVKYVWWYKRVPSCYELNYDVMSFYTLTYLAIDLFSYIREPYSLKKIIQIQMVKGVH